MLNSIVSVLSNKTSRYLPILVVIRSSFFVPMSCSNNNEMVAVTGLC